MREVQDPGSGTVILLHGLFRSRWSMAHLKLPLSRAGYHCELFGYPSTRHDIAAQDSRLNTFISSRVGAADPLHFVTHSLGSIVVRHLIEHNCPTNPLGRAVMLGPPNQGSGLARKLTTWPGLNWTLGPALRELSSLALAPATDKLDVGIIAGGRKAARGFSPFFSGDNDGIVSVAETELAGARDQLLIRGLHSFLMYYPESIRQIVYFLENGCFLRTSKDSVENSDS